MTVSRNESPVGQAIIGEKKGDIVQRHDAPRVGHRVRGRRDHPLARWPTIAGVAQPTSRADDPARRPPGQARRPARAGHRAVPRFASSHSPRAASLAERMATLEAGEETDDIVSVAGRVVAKRDQGKVVFLVMRDAHRRAPAVLPLERAWRGRGFSAAKDLDLGDWVGADRSRPAHPPGRALRRSRPR